MRVLHLAAGNRWTGAAAPAFAETAALREAGVDAHYAYVGGYKLEQKLAHIDFAHPLIVKAQNPVAFAHTTTALARLIDHHRFDVVHAHLTYDHWLALFAARHTHAAVVRTFHARRVLRSDPFTRWLLLRSDAFCVINDSFVTAPPVASRKPLFTPPPVDQREFAPEGPDVRGRYGIEPQTPLLLAIGKLAPGRGFEDVLRTYALVRRDVPAARLMIIGHGPHRPALESLAAELQIEPIWAGYHEDDLAEHYRAADVLLFTARGSDEGHRAILEAMSCGVVPVPFPIEGVHALVERDFIAAAATPDSASAKVVEILRADVAALRRRAYARSEAFGYPRAAERLIQMYGELR